MCGGDAGGSLKESVTFKSTGKVGLLTGTTSKKECETNTVICFIVCFLLNET